MPAPSRAAARAAARSLLDSSGAGLLLGAYLTSGAAGLLYEVIWSRLLALYLGHTLAATATVLAAFMGGLAGGAAMGGAAARRLLPVSALRSYAGLELLVAVSALLLPHALPATQPLLAAAYEAGEGGTIFALARVATSLALVSLPAMLMGATYPLAVRGTELVWPGAAGRLYAVNTAGAAAGAALAGFLLLPVLGFGRSTLAGVGLNVVAAAAAWRAAP
ncbi:MAG TPA: hypothetical protein VNI83_10160, partial [Vicinamibacterales bacterium]|nr:hypothetical protein [Vicinamibacterales bacterium]